MGQFSWLTGDTRRSITNVDAEQGALPVYLILPDDSYLYEDAYDGYGRFGGRDFFGLVWQLNSSDAPKRSVQYPPESGMDEEFDREFDERHRIQGLDLYYRDDNRLPGAPLGPPVVLPRFAERVVPWASLPDPEYCPNQGSGWEGDDDA